MRCIGKSGGDHRGDKAIAATEALRCRPPCRVPVAGDAV
jgi:hypothetical protein